MKKRSLTRLLSAFLASATILSAAPAVLAREYEDVNEEHFALNEIDMLSDIGVIRGTSENEFSPNENVTREQMALLLFRLMLNKSDGGHVNTSPFRDLYDETYHGAISWANASGYILGTSPETFEPLEGITLQDAMTMLVRALGQASPSMNNGYPWTYIDAAIKLGLDRGLEHIPYSETLTRAETAVILYNALTAEYLVPKTLSNGLTVYESSTIIEKVFGYEMDEAMLVATNNYSLTGSTVVKDNFVTLHYVDDTNTQRSMTVNFEQMDLKGDADDYLGQTVKVIYSVQSGSRLIDVLSAVRISEIESYTNATVNTKNGYVTIGGTNYAVVENYSDALATNSNELLVFAYENDKSLSQITTLEALNNRLGLYQLDLIFYGNSDTASIALLRNYQAGELKVDGNGKINIAGNLKAEELTGGYTNKPSAQNGEYVLYYFNSQTKELIIHDVLDIITGIVTRITGTSAKISGESFTLGNEKAGILPSAIAQQLTIGTKAQVAVYNGAVLAVIGETVTSSHSEYLVAMSAALPVFHNGEFRYVVTANIDGVNRNIYVNQANVEIGKVYRYIANGEQYTLIAPELDGENKIQTGINSFVQNAFGVSEIALIINSADKTTIAKDGHTFFTLNAGNAALTTSEGGSDLLKFVTDANTTIVTVNNGQIQFRTGSYNSGFSINDGSRVVAIFENEVGSVETLRYLYISDGSMSNYEVSAQTVRILALSGIVYEDDTTFMEYVVFNYHTGEVENRLTKVVGLTTGGLYALGTDGTIVDIESSVGTGTLTGYTESTVTVGEETYAITSATKVVTLDKDLNVVSKAVKDAYNMTVDFVANGNEISLILIHPAASN